MASARVGRGVRYRDVENFVNGAIGWDLHVKRVKSLANATLGVMRSASLAIHAIGQGLAHARGLLRKHAVKQVDRLLSNAGIDVWSIFAHWVPYIVGWKPEIFVAMDWTDFDADDQATIMLSLITGQGRATPLVWKTVRKSQLRRRRNAYEDEVLRRLAEVLPAETRVTIVADRGFGDRKLYAFLKDDLKFDYVIRFKDNIRVTSAQGETRTAAEWIGPGGRTKTLRGAQVTKQSYLVPTIVCTHAKGMKNPWCLASSRMDLPGSRLIKLYGKRWEIETGFRDTKDFRYGLGMALTRIGSPERRDRLWLLNAFAVVLLTLLGAAGEGLGYDKHLKVNTAKHRTHSLFRQGCMHYDALPTMPSERLRPLMKQFGEMIQRELVLTNILDQM